MIMKAVFIFILSMLMALFGHEGDQLSDIFDPCSNENLAFSGGEEVVYKIYYHWNFVWFSAGEVTFHIKETDKYFDITARGKTYRSYEWFYKVDDYYRTLLDKETMLPLLFERDIQEGDYKFYNKIEFDQKNGLIKTYDGKTKKDLRVTESRVSGCIHDMMSIIYHLRNRKYGGLRKGDKFPVEIFLDHDTWKLEVEFAGRVPDFKVKGMGYYRALQFKPEVIAGFQFPSDTKLNIWVSDDLNKVPLLVESPISVGSVKAVLKSYKGLKHPLVSKVK